MYDCLHEEGLVCMYRPNTTCIRILCECVGAAAGMETNKTWKPFKTGQPELLQEQSEATRQWKSSDGQR